jgi:uncharacterized repeat protein (TIGR03806 family)
MKKYYLTALALVFFTAIIVSCSDDEYVAVEDVLPVATDDTFSNDLTSYADIPVLLNDTTGDVVVPNTVSIINGSDTDSNGTLDQLTVANQGVWKANPTTGIIRFTPLNTFVGNPTQISYTVKDAQNNISNPGIVTINATPIVNFDITQVPYATLSNYHFFIGELKNQIPSLNVIPYEPASALFTDYAQKKRFMWMPPNVQATYNTDGKILNYPVGTVLIKSFYYTTIQPANTTQIIETRLMIRKSDGWKFYEYLWNDAQTEANLVAGDDFINGSTKTITFKKPNNEIITAEYRIPSDSECIACHKINEIATPIGVKPQNLNKMYAYSEGSKNQLQKMVEQGYLASYPSSIVTTVDYHDTSQSLELRVRSYVDANCAHCHQNQGRCDYRALRLGFGDTANPTNIGICVVAAEEISPTLQKIITPGLYSKSIMHFRMASVDESERMPMLGRTIVHDEGVALLEQWITSLTQTCN